MKVPIGTLCSNSYTSECGRVYNSGTIIVNMSCRPSFQIACLNTYAFRSSAINSADNIIIIDNQQDATILIYLFLISSTCFGRCFRPSSGAYHCNYSFWYCPPMLLLAVDNTRSCSYSDMLLMMGENIVRNM